MSGDRPQILALREKLEAQAVFSRLLIVDKAYHSHHMAAAYDAILSPDNNPLEPKWRNFIRIAEIPWVRGYAVQGRVVYPASGYICMVLEAVRQQARYRGESDKNVLYVLRDINITRALLVPEDSKGVEIIFSLRPYPQTARSSSATWNEFRVFSVSGNGDWGEHCRGLM
ncbi:MAG: hypothetical protein Q9200_000632 [Gallowayella weberi]